MSISTIKKLYGFKSLNILQKLEGFSAENYLALADDNPVIIKYCSDESKVKKAINIANLLLTQYLPVPNFLKSLKGYQYIKTENKFAYLYPKIDGDEFGQQQFNTTSFKSIAKALDQIHTAQCILPKKPQTAENIDELIALIRNNSKGINMGVLRDNYF